MPPRHLGKAPGPAPIIVWFRLDLRLADNPALAAAAAAGGPVIPVFIWAPEEEAPWAPGAASRWWLHQSLKSFSGELEAIGSRLVVLRGPSLDVLKRVVAETSARGVFWNRRYEPAVIQRDTRIKSALADLGCETRSFNAALLREPWTLKNTSGKPFQVFGAFWKSWQAQALPEAPLPRVRRLGTPLAWPKSLSLDQLRLEPTLPWAAGLAEAWQPGTEGALSLLRRFTTEAWKTYDTDRDVPATFGTSRLSPHLHFGEVSPRQIWSRILPLLEQEGSDWRSARFLAELGWREFAHHLLYHFPHTPDQPLQEKFARLRWRNDAERLAAWRKGQTGYPLVDAGMRQLWKTGWMHNRLRMVTGSFLVKDLLTDWRQGARWFWDTLVDADLAQNTLGWQWVAGCGADAAPFFRVFNPATQSKRFDPEGAFIRSWVPEIASLTSRWIHAPHAAPPETLAAASVQLGETYPAPIISHAIAREVALEAYQKL